jgi:hypothetical protein
MDHGLLTAVILGTQWEHSIVQLSCVTDRWCNLNRPVKQANYAPLLTTHANRPTAVCSTYVSVGRSQDKLRPTATPP